MDMDLRYEMFTQRKELKIAENEEMWITQSVLSFRIITEMERDANYSKRFIALK